jgi:chaperonin GroES
LTTGYAPVPSALVSADTQAEAALPIRMLHDRVLVRLEGKEGERRSTAGIVIPATAVMGRRLSWATAVSVGPNVRSIVVGDRVLFDPDDRSEVELQGRDYVLLRERDVHAVAASRVEPDGTGLYL